ncbi:MAG: aspartate aminotransferase family protein [Deltaproteobacteria bacterium]|nr:aspartate aminotransferase family protein [Deltaproteobacteria bacterium]
MDNQTFRRWGHELIDWVADYLDEIETFPVRSPVEPGDVRSQLPPTAPEQGEPMQQLMDDFQTIILPGMTHWQHPSWFAYFPANSSPPSILAELLTAGLGAQCMVWQTSPAAAELEERVMCWLRQMLGLPEQLTGVIHDTASTATLCALVTAREKATDWAANERGVAEQLVVYTSREAHSSVEKGAKIAGFGKNNVRTVPTDERFAMIPQRLDAAITDDLDAGLLPACVVATVGTTSSAAVDPLGPIGAVCERRGVWLHVDAAYAGTAAILPEKRWILDGIERADSFVFNPHKWMLTNFDCSAYFVRDPAALLRTFEIHPEYLKTGVDAEVDNYRDWGIPLGRRFRALKLWFVIRSYGVEGLRQVVREHIRFAELFRDWVGADDRFELLAPVEFGLVCFRLNDGRPEDQLDALNEQLLDRINATGKVFLTHTTLAGRYTLRMMIGARTTQERHVEAAWDLISKTADEINR